MLEENVIFQLSSTFIFLGISTLWKSTNMLMFVLTICLKVHVH